MTKEEVEQQIEQTKKKLKELKEQRHEIIQKECHYLNKCWKITDDSVVRIFKCRAEERDNYGDLLWIRGELFNITGQLQYNSYHCLYTSYLEESKVEQISEEEYRKLFKEMLKRIETYSYDNRTND